MQAKMYAAEQMLAGNTAVTCRHSHGAAAKADDVDTTSGGETERLSAQEMNGAAEGNVPSFDQVG